jgi:cobalt-zinc-cadmium efflux system protein
VSSHTGHAHGPAADRRRLRIALAISLATGALELAGGLITGSLALLADAGHVLVDSGALLMALGAVWVAQRPHSLRWTYGFHRVEVFVATINGLTLLALAGVIAWHAARRLGTEPTVEGGGLLLVATLGFGANLVALYVLRNPHDSVNVRAARLHVLSDLGGSVAAVAAGLVVTLTGWTRIDPLLSLAIVALVSFGALRLLRETFEILLERVPRSVDLGAIEAALREDPAILSIHDVHCWTVTSGFIAFTAHVELTNTDDVIATTRRASDLLRDRFGIGHVTLQAEAARTVTLTDAAPEDGAPRAAGAAPERPTPVP